MCHVISYIIHHTPYTIHHKPYIIHHTPYTIHHSRFTIHHSPFIIHHIKARLLATSIIASSRLCHRPAWSRLSVAVLCQDCLWLSSVKIVCGCPLSHKTVCGCPLSHKTVCGCPLSHKTVCGCLLSHKTVCGCPLSHKTVCGCLLSHKTVCGCLLSHKKYCVATYIQCCTTNFPRSPSNPNLKIFDQMQNFLYIVSLLCSARIVKLSKIRNLTQVPKLLPPWHAHSTFHHFTFSLLNLLPCLQTCCTRRMSGTCLRTFRSENCLLVC